VNHSVRISDHAPLSLGEDGTEIVSVPIFVMTKSTRAVPSGCNGPLGIRISSRTGRWAECPGLVEPGNGPLPLRGPEGCVDASIVIWFCASPTRIKLGLSNTAKSNSNFNRRTVSSQQVGGSITRCIRPIDVLSLVNREIWRRGGDSNPR